MASWCHGDPRPCPTEQERRNPSVRYALAPRTAAATFSPRASRAAIAADSTHPVP
jgi:hypothetical protein